MPKVTFELLSETGQFQTADADGREIVVEAGKHYTTSDLVVIAELDRASHAVRRVVKTKSTDKEE